MSGGSNYAVAGLVTAIVLILMGVGSLVGLVYIWVRTLFWGEVADDIARCARCGYAVRGVGSLSCPECGVDLREAGIVSPSMGRKRIAVWLFILLWTLCLPIPGCVLSGIAIAVGPRGNQPQEDLELEAPDTQSAGYDTVQLFRRPFDDYSGLLLLHGDYMDVSVGGSNKWDDYMVDLNTMTYEDWSGVGASPGSQPFDRAAVESWMINVGANTTDADVQLQIDEVHRLIKNTQSQGLTSQPVHAFTVNYSSAGTSDNPARWWVLAQPVFWLMVYVGGIAFFLWIRAKRAARSAQAQAKWAGGGEDAIGVDV